ncbi:glycosyltransferase family protein [Flavobacterium subsaxonicum]|uniref:Uncharacterized protein n=1 Tax=Flavobacterium subsaxonicum WB 4.1-42 = DSM 21790 TaxID=1121898 RepID=A0A0A2MRZ9_9FLAO|nr:glycosyltransferase [Flavobacterium subsaxonicum]KGO95109.1 hypothetical protein Q766_03130 [Flavobacterium subsaxonicum WB 4.1-42 = DSM 21790]
MRILIIGKLPPIEGGAANLTLGTALALVSEGHFVDLLSDCLEVEPTMRDLLFSDYNGFTDSKLNFHYPTQLGKFVQFPSSSLRMERLIGKAIQLTSLNKYDLIIGWYIIPYAYVALKASKLNNIKLMIIHGGSDIMTLSEHEDLKFLIKDILSNADIIITANNEITQSKLIELGASKSQFAVLPRGLPLPIYHKNKENESLETLCSKILDEITISFQYDHEIKALFNQTSAYKKPSGTVFTIYGKVSSGKSTNEILKSLNLLAEEGHDFTLIGAFCGERDCLKSSLEFVTSHPELLRRSILLPAVAPWIIPILLAHADVGICSEFNYGVVNHYSIIPREMMNAGLALIVSRDIANSPFYKWILKEHTNTLVVDNPACFTSIFSQILEDDLKLFELKKLSLDTSRYVEHYLSVRNPIVDIIAELEKNMLIK